MMTLLPFAGIAILLTVEGRWLIAILSRGNLTRSEEWALGFPAGAFVNVLLFFGYTVGGIPLNGVAVFGGHLGVLLIVFGVMLLCHAERSAESRSDEARRRSTSHKVIFTLLLLAIAIKLFYGVSHAFLPSYSYDTVSQWNMRAKISYEDRAIAFDLDEARGMSKPQYPILVHSLQILFNLPRFETAPLRHPEERGTRVPSVSKGGAEPPQRDVHWSDAVANGATLILSLTSFFAFFLLLRRLAGSSAALIILSCIFTIPLLSIHLAQGYGDIHVLTYFLLSAALFLLFQKERNVHLFLLSAIFIAASAWVKQEGLVFGVGPWMVIVGIGGWKVGKLRGLEVLRFWGLVLLLSLPWSFLLLAKGLPLSPHGGGDLTIGWHPEGISLALHALFAGGSFGIHWYLVIGLLLCALFERVRRGGRVEKRSSILILLWGMIAFLGALFIFLCTSNFEFLANAQTFNRTMLLPLSLLILGTFLLFYYNGSHGTEDGHHS